MNIRVVVYATNIDPLYLRSIKPCIFRSSGSMEYTMNIISEDSIIPNSPQKNTIINELSI